MRASGFGLAGPGLSDLYLEDGPPLPVDLQLRGLQVPHFDALSSASHQELQVLLPVALLHMHRLQLHRFDHGALRQARSVHV